MAEINVRPMTAADIDAVHAIEVECFAIPWSRESFLDEVTKNMCARYLVLTEDDVPIAYAGMWLVIDEGHITNIAVTKSARGKGYGEKITRALIQLAADTGIGWMTLEVRASNEPAKNLYRKLGFQEIGRRKRYYADNNEDAILMALDKMPEGNPDNDPFLIRED